MHMFAHFVSAVRAGVPDRIPRDVNFLRAGTFGRQISVNMYLRVIFVLSTCTMINNVPESFGLQSQSYTQTTLSQILTPSEQQNYLQNGVLPSRVYYSSEHGTYVVNENNNGLGKPPGDGQYKVVPRWEYMLGKLVPDFSSMGMGDWYGGGGDNNEGNNDKSKDDGNIDKSKDDGNNDKSKDDDKKDENKDENNEGGGFDTQMAKDILTSDVTKDIAKILIGFAPGGSAALTAMDRAGTIADAAHKIAKLH